MTAPRGTPIITSAPPMTEKDLARTVLDYAKLRNWRSYFTWYRASVNEHRQGYQVAGFPDLTLVRESADGTARLVFAELKARGKKPTPAQEEWLAVLRKVPGAEVYLWDETDLKEIMGVLE